MKLNKQVAQLVLCKRRCASCQASRRTNHEPCRAKLVISDIMHHDIFAQYLKLARGCHVDHLRNQLNIF